MYYVGKMADDDIIVKVLTVGAMLASFQKPIQGNCNIALTKSVLMSSKITGINIYFNKHESLQLQNNLCVLIQSTDRSLGLSIIS